MCGSDIETFYEVSQALVEYNENMLQLVTKKPQGSKLMAPGRVVVLRDHVCILRHAIRGSLTKIEALQNQQYCHPTESSSYTDGGVREA